MGLEPLLRGDMKNYLHMKMAYKMVKDWFNKIVDNDIAIDLGTANTLIYLKRTRFSFR